jgi:hypothetical protein
MNFCLYFLYVCINLGEIRYMIVDFHFALLSSCQLNENRFCESHMLRSGVNEFLSLIFTFVDRFG